MIILGIDPGYEKLGVAIIEKLPNQKKEKYIFSDCVTTSRSLSHAERLYKIATSIREIIQKYKPESLGIEKLFFNTNQTTATKVAEARGVVLAAAAEGGLSIAEFTPLEIKVAVTGYGRSEKKQVISMVTKLLMVDKKIKEDDEYDALAAALTYSACNASMFKPQDINK